ncbi:uncharacterized protein L201_002650 [Kwoniella dendrophila CBS 6074]|uniref:BZIP domain-containing protein n=1 Tax=Kwoniella dendrophila CBS 6074 TaxID=1295534 RepID=A0AAX4JS62_9TREE
MEDSGGEEYGHFHDDAFGEGGKGSSSSQVRKAQNRIAQREFRLRKQQYIRDLEARVEVLSGDKEERIELMTLLVRNLLKENKELRGMVKSMAGFVGEGLGSCLPRLGLSADGLDAILNRSDTDTAYEAFVNLKASKGQTLANPGIKVGDVRRRASSMKRKRDATGDEERSTEKGKNRAGSETLGLSKSASGSGTPINTESTSLPPQFYNFQPGEGEDYHYLFPDLDTLLAEGGPGPFGRSSPLPTSTNTNTNQQSSGSGTSSHLKDLPNLSQQQPPFGPPPEHGERYDPRSFPSGSGLQSNGSQLGYAHHIVPSELGGTGTPKATQHSNIPLMTGNMSGYYGVTNSPTAIGAGGGGGDQGGFGLTLPLPPSSSINYPNSGPGTSSSSNSTNITGRSAENPISSLSGPRPVLNGITSQGNYARGHPSILTNDANSTDLERQQSLREAVATMTNSDNPLEGPGVTAAELAERRRQQDELMRIIEEGDPADRKMETMQLITYHLNNFRANHDYHLPPSLRPTVVQRTIPHEHAIDGIIFPSIRDRMILLRGRYDLVEVFHAMLTEFELHGDDVLDHTNYEISEKFIDDYSILIDDIVISISNKWRSQRGLPLLKMPEKDFTGNFGGGHRIHDDHSSNFRHGQGQGQGQS